MARKRYSPKLKFQVVLEALTGEKTPGQIAKQYGIHPNSVGLWKKQFLERGAELFSQDDTVQEYERRLARFQGELERITSMLADIEKAKAKFEAAYERDIYTLDEFEEKMKSLRRESQALEGERTEALRAIEQAHTLEEQKEVLLTGLGRIRQEIDEAKTAGRQPDELPFALKRRVLELLVDIIRVNSVEGTFTIEGVIQGSYAFGDEQLITIEMPQTLPQQADLAFVSGRKNKGKPDVGFTVEGRL